MSTNQSHDFRNDMIAKSLRLLRLSLNGALVSVALFGSAAALIGFDTSVQTDALAAAVGGGGTALLLLKASIAV